MPDTPRTIAALQALFADNSSGAISPQDLRDFLVTVVNYLDAVVIAPANTDYADVPDGLGAPLRINLPEGHYDVSNTAVSIVDEDGIQVMKLRATNNAAGVQVVSPDEEGATAFVDCSVDGGTSGDVYVGTDLGLKVNDSNLTMDELFTVRTGSPTRTMLKITPDGAGDGVIKIGNLSTPADGDLNASELALWFDSTNGAAKLKLKGKTANGTVVTGEVALA